MTSGMEGVLWEHSYSAQGEGVGDSGFILH